MMVDGNHGPARRPITMPQAAPPDATSPDAVPVAIPKPPTNPVNTHPESPGWQPNPDAVPPIYTPPPVTDPFLDPNNIPNVPAPKPIEPWPIPHPIFDPPGNAPAPPPDDGIGFDDGSGGFFPGGGPGLQVPPHGGGPHAGGPGPQVPPHGGGPSTNPPNKPNPSGPSVPPSGGIGPFTIPAILPVSSPGSTGPSTSPGILPPTTQPPPGDAPPPVPALSGLDTNIAALDENNTFFNDYASQINDPNFTNLLAQEQKDINALKGAQGPPTQDQIAHVFHEQQALADLMSADAPNITQLPLVIPQILGGTTGIGSLNGPNGFGGSGSGGSSTDQMLIEALLLALGGGGLGGGGMLGLGGLGLGGPAGGLGGGNSLFGGLGNIFGMGGVGGMFGSSGLGLNNGSGANGLVNLASLFGGGLGSSSPLQASGLAGSGSFGSGTNTQASAGRQNPDASWIPVEMTDPATGQTFTVNPPPGAPEYTGPPGTLKHWAKPGDPLYNDPSMISVGDSHGNLLG